MNEFFDSIARDLAALRISRLHAAGTPRAPRVMLLASGLGWGHTRAADALAEALPCLAPQVEIRRLDFWSLMNPGVAAKVQQTYLEIVQRNPELYDWLHQLDQRSWRRILLSDVEPPPEVLELVEIILANNTLGELLKSALGPYPSDVILYPTACATLASSNQSASLALTRLAFLRWAWLRLQRRLEQHIAEFNPDVVVSTQMVPAALVSVLKRQRRMSLPSIGVLTDFGVHDFWLQPGTDLLCLPDASLVDPALTGLGGSRFEVTGIPLVQAFANPPLPFESRRALGLDPAAPVVTILGGGLGLGVETVTRRVLEAIPNLHVLVMTGCNATARSALAPLAARYGARLQLHEWTDRIERFLSASDIVVGKPGGLTVAEALACGRPLLATRSLRGQEGFNVDFLERHAVGRLVEEPELPAQIERWFADPDGLAATQARAARLGHHRDAAMRIAGITLEMTTQRTGQFLAQEG